MKVTISLIASGYDEPISTFCTDDSELDPLLIALFKDNPSDMGFYLADRKGVAALMEAINPKQEITTNQFINKDATDNDVYLDVRRSFYKDFIDNDVWAIAVDLPENYLDILRGRK
ncbi:hypothetical protein [Rosenbergiella nectarea]|uniref:hypothetical protein n=1 Tax=Rosenbergiella nectarea TaxID=988801 RepID=UPI001F4E92AB|nr:hypothetical protein [Rosenbergiella nectarea]